MKKLFLAVLLVGMASIANINALTCDDIKDRYIAARNLLAMFEEDNISKKNDSIKQFQTVHPIELIADSYDDIIIGCNTRWQNPQDHQLTFPGKTQDEVRIIIMRRNISDFRNRGRKADFDMPNARRSVADMADKLIDELAENFKAEDENNKESENQ